MDVEVKVEGLQVLEARLQELDALAGEKLLKSVLRRIAKPMAERIRSNARSMSKHGSSGALARSIAVVTRKPRGKQVAVVAVTSKSKDRTALYLHNAFYGRRRKGIFYGWMVEKGHATKSRPVPGNPWFWPAANAAQGQAVNAFVGEMKRAVARLEKRTGKTANPDSLVPP